MSTLARMLIGVAAGAAVLIAVVLLARGHAPWNAHRQPSRALTSAGTVTAPRIPASGTARQRLTVAQVQGAFVRSYTAYLDGRGRVSALRYASVTAREQARFAGQIPPAFRDGLLHVQDARALGTGYSARVVVTLVNRSESYVLTVALLRTQFGWQVAQLAPPDLTIDDQTRPVSGAPIPRAGQLASVRLARAYAAYRSHAARRPAAITAVARGQLGARQDPLASSGLSGGQPRVLAVRYGPFEGTEFAVTATVAAGDARRQFSVLMVKTPGGWECDAFL